MRCKFQELPVRFSDASYYLVIFENQTFPETSVLSINGRHLYGKFNQDVDAVFINNFNTFKIPLFPLTSDF